MNKINDVWNKILDHAGEIFYTSRRLEFTYKIIDDHTIRPYRDGKTRWDLSKNLFEKALQFSNFSGKEFNKTIIGSSYVRGILEDRRINQ